MDAVTGEHVEVLEPPYCVPCFDRRRLREYSDCRADVASRRYHSGSDADLLSRALSEVKTKVYEKSGVQLDDTQALDALVSYFLNAE